jgi:hypothetical protein
MSTTNQPEQPQSRLDRELDEILEQARSRPISLQDRVIQKRSAVQARRHTGLARARHVGTGAVHTTGSWLLRVPLVTALVFALIAVWVAPESSALAVVLGLVAAAFIFVPFFIRRPSDELVYQKRWRGRPMAPPRSSGGVRGLIDSARDRLQR